VWNGHSCPLPLTLPCHPEEAESRAKRATPDEEPALSLPKGPMHLASRSSTRAKSKTGKGTTSVVPQEGKNKEPGFSR
jgi:hypothetical protein